jgi:hypothetical protein
MRIGGVGIVLFACVCGFFALAPAAEPADQYLLLRQANHEVSAAKQRPRSKPAPVQAPVRHRGFADPSIGPDGRPYQVPEYLRNQCYIDEGYGRFSACENR